MKQPAVRSQLMTESRFSGRFSRPTTDFFFFFFNSRFIPPPQKKTIATDRHFRCFTRKTVRRKAVRFQFRFRIYGFAFDLVRRESDRFFVGENPKIDRSHFHFRFTTLVMVCIAPYPANACSPSGVISAFSPLLQQNTTLAGKNNTPLHRYFRLQTGTTNSTAVSVSGTNYLEFEYVVPTHGTAALERLSVNLFLHPFGTALYTYAKSEACFSSVSPPQWGWRSSSSVQKIPDTPLPCDAPEAGRVRGAAATRGEGVVGGLRGDAAALRLGEWRLLRTWTSCPAPCISCGWFERGIRVSQQKKKDTFFVCLFVKHTPTKNKLKARGRCCEYVKSK